MNSTFVLQEIKRGSFVARIGYDEYCESPRKSCDNLGIIFSDFGRRYGDPDGRALSELEDENGEINPVRLDEMGVWLPIRMYERRGVDFWTEEGCGLPDACGVIIAPWDKVRAKYPNWTTDEVKKRLSAEVGRYSRWAGGEVYMYEIESPNGEIVDSRGGYIGDFGLSDAIKGALDWSVEDYIAGC